MTDGVINADRPLDRAVGVIVDALRSGGTLYACGNGGSHAHADHLVAELIGRFAYDRPPLRAVLLSSNGAVGSCIANDYGWQEVFRRQIEALVTKRDVVVVFTTSGKSENVVAAAMAADYGATAPVVALTGPHGVDRYRESRGVVVRSTATTTPAIQEQHQIWIHEVARRVEAAMFPRSE